MSKWKDSLVVQSMSKMLSPNLNIPDGVTVFIRNANTDIMICWGDTVPSDEETGYATGCIFIKTDDGVIYHNKGSEESADFDALADVS